MRGAKAESGSSSIQTIVIVSAVALGGITSFGTVGDSLGEAIAEQTTASANHTGQAGRTLGGRIMAGSDDGGFRSSASEPTTFLSTNPQSVSTLAQPAANGGRGIPTVAPGFTGLLPSGSGVSTSPHALGLLQPAAISLAPANRGVALAFGAQSHGGGANAASGEASATGAAGAAADGLTALDLAMQRGAIHLAMQGLQDLIIAAYDSGELSDQEKRARIADLGAMFKELSSQDEALEQEQALLDSYSPAKSLLRVLGYVSDGLMSPNGDSILDARLDDREALDGLKAEREQLVREIEALKESGASVERYSELQARLAELDGRIEDILERDADRLASQSKLGALVILPGLQFELTAVGPEVGNSDAVRDYLRSKAVVSADHLVAIMPNLPRALAQTYEPLVNKAMEEASINTPQRRAAFLAQLAHESIGLTAFEELASGAAYEWRTDLGNVHAGDGRRYKGRGPIQLTGRANYRAAGADLGLPLESNPELASEPEIGFRIAAWYWETRGLNELADAGNFEKITYRINGGYNGAADRRAYWERAKGVLY